MEQDRAGGASVLDEPDVPQLHAITLTPFVEEEDAMASPIGAKGIGEIGIVGVAAAVANAVAHATGRRIRSLPITPDKVIG